MQVDPPRRSDRFHNRQAGQLVPERDAGVDRNEHPRAEAFVDAGIGLSRERVDEPPLGMRRRNRHGIENLPRLRCQPGGAREHGVTNRGGHLLSTGFEHLGHEEGIAAGQCVETVGVDAVRVGEPCNRIPGERCGCHPRDGDTRRQLPQQHPERMARVDRLVAIAEHDQYVSGGNSAREQPDHVEGRLVRPVRVLDHEHGHLVAAQLLEERRGDLIRRRLGEQKACKGRPHLEGDVVDRPERTSREERVAGAPQHVRRRRTLGAEALDQGGLPAAGLGRDDGQAAVSCDGPLERGFERGQVLLTLDERVGSILAAPSRLTRSIVNRPVGHGNPPSCSGPQRLSLHRPEPAAAVT